MSFVRRSDPRTSLRVRLTTLFVAIFAVTLILFSLVLYRVFLANHREEFDTALYNYTVDLASSVEVGLFGEVTLGPGVLGESQKLFPFALGESFVQLRTVSGKTLAKSPGLAHGSLPFEEADRRSLESQRASFRTLEARELSPGRLSRLSRLSRMSRLRMISYVVDRPGLGTLVLQVAVPMLLFEKEQRGLLAFFAVAIPVILLIAAFGGMYLSSRALAPVNAIIAKAREITARNLSARLPVPPVADEIQQLARTLNQLLGRIEEAFRAQESFVADASHQLKTPLAILRGEIDLMLSRPRNAGEIEDFLQSASQEVGYLSRMVEDLLVLARIDAGAGALSVREVRLDEAVTDAASRLERLARAKAVKLSVRFTGDVSSPGAFEVRGDADLLRGVAENLIENAIKYSPDGGLVTAELIDGFEQVRVRVSDQGPGIAPAQAERIFERFHRGETSRDRLSGSGLGLAIARRIAELHGGTVQVVAHSLASGSTFQVSLPKRSA